MAAQIQSVRIQPGSVYKRNYQEWRLIPPVDCSDDHVLQYVKRVIPADEKNQARRYEMFRMSRNLWFYLGRQWIIADRTLSPSSTGGYHFRDVTQAWL